jgi:hypothetical protein
MQYARGFTGARWLVTDPNDDQMVFKVEIRGLNEREWKLLKDEVVDRYISWDSTAYPDGEYVVRVTASDAPDNPPDKALTSEIVSDRFTIDNTPPQVTNLVGSRSGNTVTVKWQARDERSIIQKAEYSVDGGDWMVVEPATRLSDAPQLDYTLTAKASGTETTIAVRVTDEFENQSVDKVVIR